MKRARLMSVLAIVFSISCANDYKSDMRTEKEAPMSNDESELALNASCPSGTTPTSQTALFSDYEKYVGGAAPSSCQILNARLPESIAEFQTYVCAPGSLVGMTPVTATCQGPTYSEFNRAYIVEIKQNITYICCMPQDPVAEPPKCAAGEEAVYGESRPISGIGQSCDSEPTGQYTSAPDNLARNIKNFEDAFNRTCASLKGTPTAMVKKNKTFYVDRDNDDSTYKPVATTCGMAGDKDGNVISTSSVAKNCCVKKASTSTSTSTSTTSTSTRSSTTSTSSRTSSTTTTVSRSSTSSTTLPSTSKTTVKSSTSTTTTRTTAR